MRRVITAISLAASLMLAPSPGAAAPDAYDDSQSHPLRIAAYLAHPLGYAVEWLVFRPFHFLVSSYPDIFGHRPHGTKRLES